MTLITLINQTKLLFQTKIVDSLPKILNIDYNFILQLFQ